jgi:hypothetical protein
MSTDHAKPIRRPEDITDRSMNDLVEQWSNARMRAFLATHAEKRQPDADDLFAELAYGARIAQEATCGRWCAVADLLRAGTTDSWAEIGSAMAMTEAEARNGFHDWINRQRDLRYRTGTIGLADAEAAELHDLAEAVTW